MPQNPDRLTPDTVMLDDRPEPVVFNPADILDAPEDTTAQQPQATPEPQPTPKPATPAAEKPKADAKPAEPKAADAGPAKADTPAATPADTPPAFDPTAYGLSADEYKHCKTVAEALQLMASRQKNLNMLLARQSNELGELRQRTREAATPGQPIVPKPPATPGQPAPAAAAPTQAQIEAVTAQWTDEQRAKFEAWAAEDPARAYGALAQHVAAALLQPERERVNAQLAELNARLAAAEAAPKQARMEQEYAEFQRTHLAEWDKATARVEKAAKALDVDPNVDDRIPLADLYALGALAETEPLQFETVVGYVALGLPFSRALRFAQLEADDVKRTAADRQREQDEAKKREDEARAQADAAARKTSRVALAGKGTAGNADTRVNFGDIEDL
jgi:hypothetical protein